MGQFIPLLSFLLAFCFVHLWYRFKSDRQPAKAVFPGSFDPMQEGHVALVVAAAKRCRQLVVLIAVNPDKKGVFTPDERAALVRRYVAREGLTNVTVAVTDGLVLDWCALNGATAIFRGYRDAKDSAEERRQMDLNERISPGIPTILIKQTDDFLRLASSTLAKGCAKLDVHLPGLVPAFVAAPVIRREHGLITIGVVGTIACGKSYVTTKLVERLRQTYGATHVYEVDFDALLVRGVYAGTTEGCQRVRGALARRFGPAILSSDGTKIETAVLKGKLFGSPRADRDRAWVVELTRPLVMALYRDFLRGKKGLVFVQMAQLLEMGLAGLVCNQVLIVGSPDRDGLAAKRGLPADVLAAVRALQWPTARKLTALAELHARDGGFVIVHENVRREDGPAGAAAFERDLDALQVKVMGQVSPVWAELCLPVPPPVVPAPSRALAIG